MYVIARRPFGQSQLYEITTNQERVELENRYAGNIRKVSGAEAHKWVRDGGIHNTGLYLDEGRIRKAKAE